MSYHQYRHPCLMKMRKGSKCTWVEKLAVLSDNQQHIDMELLYGNEALYYANWGKVTTVQEFSNAFIRIQAKSYTVYLIFDNYRQRSLRSYERSRRSGGEMRQAQHTTWFPSSCQRCGNEICAQWHSWFGYCATPPHHFPHVHLFGEEQNKFTHEEADVCLISYLLELYANVRHIQVTSQDSDVFALYTLCGKRRWPPKVLCKSVAVHWLTLMLQLRSLEKSVSTWTSCLYTPCQDVTQFLTFFGKPLLWTFFFIANSTWEKCVTKMLKQKKWIGWE